MSNKSQSDGLNRPGNLRARVLTVEVPFLKQDPYVLWTDFDCGASGGTPYFTNQLAGRGNFMALIKYGNGSYYHVPDGTVGEPSVELNSYWQAGGGCIVGDAAREGGVPRQAEAITLNFTSPFRFEAR